MRDAEADAILPEAMRPELVTNATSGDLVLEAERLQKELGRVTRFVKPSAETSAARASRISAVAGAAATGSGDAAGGGGRPPLGGVSRASGRFTSGRLNLVAAGEARTKVRRSPTGCNGCNGCNADRELGNWEHGRLGLRRGAVQCALCSMLTCACASTPPPSPPLLL